jgi:hypothetical protein
MILQLIGRFFISKLYLDGNFNSSNNFGKLFNGSLYLESSSNEIFLIELGKLSKEDLKFKHKFNCSTEFGNESIKF